MSDKNKDKDNEGKKKIRNPKVHKDLDGFNMEIDSFGELKSTFNIEKINEFLNRNVDDKKLGERKDYDKIKEKGKFKKGKKNPDK